MDEPTYCVNCKHFGTKRQGKIWYDQYCCHPNQEREEEIDPVTGKSGYARKNDLGRRIIIKDKHPYARDVNKRAKCPLFESIETEEKVH